MAVCHGRGVRPIGHVVDRPADRGRCQFDNPVGIPLPREGRVIQNLAERKEIISHESVT